MATYKQYTKKDGSTAWMFKAYLGRDEVTGRDITTTRRGFTSEREAKRACNRTMVDYEENGRARPVPTFQQLYDLWLEQYRRAVKPSTIRVTKSRATKHILPVFGSIKLDRLTVIYCQKVINQWKDAGQEYAYLRVVTNQILDYGVKLDVIPANPMRKTIVPRQEAKERPKNFYDREKLQHFFDCLECMDSPKESTFFRVLAFTGMRKGEALALQWKDIDLDKCSIHVTKTVAREEDGTLCIQDPKTPRSRRLIPVDGKTIGILKKWHRIQKESYLLLGYNTGSPEQYVFTTLKNQYYDDSTPNIWLQRIIDKYSLPRITVHGFRHTHCSLLFEAGASLQEVQERLGHSDIKTTMDIYTHVTEKKRQETGEKFADYVNF